MTHSANGPTVSLEEAQRIERETAERLVKARKLSLIVDLDQTIVHATVDPTVGEWIADGEAWEEKHQQRNGNADDESSDTDDEECNPNWEALRDVKKFRLGPESFGAPYEAKGKGKSIEQDGCTYYIKPRFVFSFATFSFTHLRMLDPGGKPSYKGWRPNTRCTYTLWARVLTLNKCVQLLTRTGSFLVDGCSVEMRAGVRPKPIFIVFLIYKEGRPNTEKSTTSVPL